LSHITNISLCWVWV